MDEHGRARARRGAVPRLNERIYSECYRRTHTRGYSTIAAHSNGSSITIATSASISGHAHVMARAPSLADLLAHPRRGSRQRRSAQRSRQCARQLTIMRFCAAQRARSGDPSALGHRGLQVAVSAAPESMWLPETAANDATLGTLIDEGLRFAILSPYQAERVRKIGSSPRAGRTPPMEASTADSVSLFPQGRLEAVHRHLLLRRTAIAGDRVRRSLSRVGLSSKDSRAQSGDRSNRSAATDGESYGILQVRRSMLAHALEVEAARQGFWSRTSVNSWIGILRPGKRRSPRARRLGSSWSCEHALAAGFGTADAIPEDRKAGIRLADPAQEASMRSEIGRRARSKRSGSTVQRSWAARNAYIDMILDPRGARPRFFETHAKKRLDDAETVRALTLLEMQRMRS